MRHIDDNCIVRLGMTPFEIARALCICMAVAPISHASWRAWVRVRMEHRTRLLAAERCDPEVCTFEPCAEVPNVIDMSPRSSSFTQVSAKQSIRKSVARLFMYLQTTLCPSIAYVARKHAYLPTGTCKAEAVGEKLLSKASQYKWQVKPTERFCDAVKVKSNAGRKRRHDRRNQTSIFEAQSVA
jgi:hypothetical protein